MRVPVDAERELWIYEGLRLGSVRALRVLLDDLHGDLLILGRTYGPGSAEPLVADAIGTAVRGLGMFTWHTSLRSWLFGILISAGRERVHRAAAPPSPPPQRILAADGGGQRIVAVDDVPWTGWWGPGSWDALATWLRSRPLPEQEALLLADLLGWSAEEVRDALAITSEAVALHRRRAHRALLDTLRAETGTPIDGDVGRLIAHLPKPDLDPDVQPILRDYRAWRSDRGITIGTRLRGRLRRGPSGGISASLSQLAGVV